MFALLSWILTGAKFDSVLKLLEMYQSTAKNCFPQRVAKRPPKKIQPLRLFNNPRAELIKTRL